MLAIPYQRTGTLPSVSKGKEAYLMQRTPELVCNQPNDGTIKHKSHKKISNIAHQ
jgi:hypothetical protein